MGRVQECLIRRPKWGIRNKTKGVNNAEKCNLRKRVRWGEMEKRQEKKNVTLGDGLS